MNFLHHEWRWNPAKTDRDETLVWFCFYKSRWGMFRFRKHCDHGNTYGCGWWQIEKYHGPVFRDRYVAGPDRADSVSLASPDSGFGHYAREPLEEQ